MRILEEALTFDDVLLVPAYSDRQQRAEQMNGGEAETIPFDALPPAIGRDEPESSDEPEAEPKRPRRRARTPRPETGDDEIAPAA